MGIGSTEVVLAVIFLQRKAQLNAERVGLGRSLVGGEIGGIKLGPQAGAAALSD